MINPDSGSGVEQAMSINHISPRFAVVIVIDRRLPGVLRTPGPPRLLPSVENGKHNADFGK